jgi:hypothetical protein
MAIPLCSNGENATQPSFLFVFALLTFRSVHQQIIQPVACLHRHRSLRLQPVVMSEISCEIGRERSSSLALTPRLPRVANLEFELPRPTIRLG